MYDGTDSLAIDKVWAILHQRTRQPNRRITAPAPSHGKRILRDVPLTFNSCTSRHRGRSTRCRRMKEGCAKPDPLWTSVATADGWIPPKDQVSRCAGKVRTSMATQSISGLGHFRRFARAPDWSRVPQAPDVRAQSDASESLQKETYASRPNS
jgi:hypothetical protein